MYAVATCHGLHQFAVNVYQRDGETVVLHLAAHLKLLTSQSTLHGLIPVAHILLVIGVGQRQHGITVLHLPELCLQVTTHTLGRRVGVGHLWVARLQVLQLVHQLIEVVVTDAGLVLHVIPVVMLMQLTS